MFHRAMRVIILLSLVAILANTTLGQRSASPLTTTTGFLYHIENPYAGNGIAVGSPKVFDNRSLALMLEQLDRSLERLNAIDEAKILAQLGLLQGQQSSSINRSFSISTLPIPSLDLTEKKDTNSNELQMGQRVTKAAEYTPKAPDLGTIQYPSPFDAKMGLAAQDVLSEQINLTYQIVNLRMLLERSITDRHYSDGTRAHAVLGFQVSLDPMRQHKGKAAFVEIELSSKGKKRPSLVSLMPQAKTYNVASISQKSTSFSGSAVVKIVSLGYSQKNGSQTYFIHKDADTLAFERPPGDSSDSLRFGWEFRPVLNLNSVEGGIRQLFAVVALDEPGDAEPQLDVKIHTYWASYDKKNAVVSSNPSDLKTINISDFTIPAADKIQKDLAPKVHRVDFILTGKDSSLLNVHGDNFFNGTSVIVANRVISSGDPSLMIKSDQLLQVAVKPSEVAEGQMVLAGRYGSSVDILDHHVLTNSVLRPDRFELSVEFDSPATAIVPSFEAILEVRGELNSTANLRGHPVIISVGTNTFVRSGSDWYTSYEKGTTNRLPGLRTRLQMPLGFTELNPVVSATIPFLGSDFQQSKQIFLPQSAERVVILKENDVEQEWGIIGKGFDGVTNHLRTSVIADSSYDLASLTFHDPTLIRFRIKRASIPAVKNVVVTLGDNPPILLPPPKQNSPKGSIGKTLTPNPKVGTAPSVEFAGQQLSKIIKVSFDGSVLPFWVSPDGDKVTVFLNRKVTEKPGEVALVVEFPENTLQVASFNVD
jgi:hypothetical protein